MRNYETASCTYARSTCPSFHVSFSFRRRHPISIYSRQKSQTRITLFFRREAVRPHALLRASHLFTDGNPHEKLITQFRPRVSGQPLSSTLIVANSHGRLLHFIQAHESFCFIHFFNFPFTALPNGTTQKQKLFPRPLCHQKHKL